MPKPNPFSVNSYYMIDDLEGVYIQEYALYTFK